MGFLRTFGKRAAHHLADLLFPPPPRPRSPYADVLQACIPLYQALVEKWLAPVGGTGQVVTPVDTSQIPLCPGVAPACPCYWHISDAQWAAGFGGTMGQIFDQDAARRRAAGDEFHAPIPGTRPGNDNNAAIGQLLADVSALRTALVDLGSVVSRNSSNIDRLVGQSIGRGPRPAA